MHVAVLRHDIRMPRSMARVVYVLMRQKGGPSPDPRNQSAVDMGEPSPKLFRFIPCAKSVLEG